MNQFFLMLLCSWGLLGLVVLGLALYRAKLGGGDDDHIHFSDREAALVNAQAAHAHRVEAVEKWGKALTVVLVMYGVALAAYYVYALFVAQSTRAIVD
jgi:hypothetical protein